MSYTFSALFSSRFNRLPVFRSGSKSRWAYSLHNIGDDFIDEIFGWLEIYFEHWELYIYHWIATVEKSLERGSTEVLVGNWLEEKNSWTCLWSYFPLLKTFLHIQTIVYQNIFHNLWTVLLHVRVVPSVVISHISLL